MTRLPNTLLRMPDVTARTGLSKSMVYALMKAKEFPPSISIGSTRTVAWIEAEVDAWVEGQIRRARGAEWRAGQEAL